MKTIGRPKAPLVLTAEEREELVRLTQRARVNRNLAFRAKLLLSCSDGTSSISDEKRGRGGGAVPLTAELAEVLRDHRRTARNGPEEWVFSNADGGLLRPGAIRAPLRRAFKRAGITKRGTVHGLRRTFNNLSRQVAGVIVTRAIAGHVTEEMTEHYSHVDRAEKLRAADKVVALAGLRAPAPANDVAVTAPNAPASGGSGGGLN
jgi:integrase